MLDFDIVIYGVLSLAPFSLYCFCSPSFRVPSSAAWPLGKIDLTNMPMLPRGESLPPTTLKPRPFLPLPFSKTTFWTKIFGCCNDDLRWPTDDRSTETGISGSCLSPDTLTDDMLFVRRFFDDTSPTVAVTLPMSGPGETEHRVFADGETEFRDLRPVTESLTLMTVFIAARPLEKSQTSITELSSDDLSIISPVRGADFGRSRTGSRLRFLTGPLRGKTPLDDSELSGARAMMTSTDPAMFRRTFRATSISRPRRLWPWTLTISSPIANRPSRSTKPPGSM